jgi:amino acid transporter
MNIQLQNPALFQFAGSTWTLAGVCMVSAVVIFVLWLALLPMLTRRVGTSRRMSREEAAARSFAGVNKDFVKPEPFISGPAAGKEWEITFTIGDLREAWQNRQYAYFFGVPGYLALLGLAFIIGMTGAMLYLRTWLMLVGIGFVLLILGIYLFMMWAAVYTKLE